MTTRAAELRTRHRKILGWSLGVAVVAHAAFFLLAPTFRATPLGSSTSDARFTDSTGAASAYVDVLFGPPIISAPDGSTWSEPAERRLEARRGVELPPLCVALARGGRTPARADVRLRVKASGRVEVMGLAQSSGDSCADMVLTTVAGSLWYHWLPSERFPAPVELIQPVTLTAVRD